MRRAISLLLLSFFIISPIWGQQLPQYTQYVFNNFGVNPAVAGNKECITGRIAFRSQWVGFDGAPQTLHANAHTRISRDVKGPNVGFHGVGGKAIADATGPLSRTMVYGAYAYHLPLFRGITASLGIYAGIQQVRLDVNEVTLTNGNDPVVNESRSALVYPDVSPGIWVYTDKVFAGLTIAQLANNSLSGLGEGSKLVPHYMLTGGKKFLFGSDDEFAFIPSTMIKFSPMTSPSIDLNFLMEYRGQFAAGLSYRNIDAVAAMIRFDLLKYFFLGYSFDLTTSKIRVNSANTHEVTLGFKACPGKSAPINTTCPAYY
ncbi:MAG: type IX secretion system membrane protein PorP/SprF [Flavobacteriales bacterium]